MGKIKMKRNKAFVVGRFDPSIPDAVVCDGQICKTRTIYHACCRQLGEQNVGWMDIQMSAKNLLHFIPSMIKAFRSRNIILLFSDHALLFLLPLFALLFGGGRDRRIHLITVGSSLPEFMEKHSIVRCLLSRLYAIYAQTNGMDSALQSMNLKVKIVYFPNFKPISVLEEREYTQDPFPPFPLCTFSRIVKGKGIGEAVEAIARVNEKARNKTGHAVFTLDLYGKVGSGEEQWFVELMKKYGSEEISYKGVVPYNETVEVLKNYFMLIFPTYYDGEGMAGTLVDAFSAGVPVIATDWKFNKEMVRDGWNGYLCIPRSVESLCEALEKVVASPQKVAEMRGNCTDTIKPFNEQNVMTRLSNELL